MVVEVVVVMLEALAAARNASASTLVMPTKAICKQRKTELLGEKWQMLSHKKLLYSTSHYTKSIISVCFHTKSSESLSCDWPHRVLDGHKPALMCQRWHHSFNLFWHHKTQQDGQANKGANAHRSKCFTKPVLHCQQVSIQPRLVWCARSQHCPEVVQSFLRSLTMSVPHLCHLSS